MRLLVFGGRDPSRDVALAVREVLDEWHRRRPITVVINGVARGVDTLAREWGLATPGVEVDDYPVPGSEWAAWQQGGRRGVPPGHLRNGRMLTQGRPDAALGFPGGGGTANMFKQATEAGVTVRLVVMNGSAWSVVRV